jgi:very-short-patch-repair endonuclease
MGNNRQRFGDNGILKCMTPVPIGGIQMNTTLDFSVCRICGKTIEEISKEERKPNRYKTHYFLSHLNKEHSITKEVYFGEGPECSCGQCHKKLTVVRDGKVFRWSKFACGRNPGVLKWSEESKTKRKGKGNPMYKATPWNAGLNKTNSDYGKKMSEIQTGRTTREKTKHRQSVSAKNRKIHGHTGHKHSEESKELMRQKTLERIKNNKFPQNDTLPSRELEKILKKNKVKYQKEYVLGAWSFDFCLIDANILIEVDGDYWHSNPKIYPNGPKTKTQKINRYRDLKKNKFCEQNKHKLIRFWESDILGEPKWIEQKLEGLLKSVLGQPKTLR